jgi:alcohol dehydrogenase (quinone), cytochrome c subunit
MMRIVKWAALVVVVLAACGFAAFLYFVPPLTSTAPETFVALEASMAPPVDGIADPAVRAIAERGRYVLMTTDCTGCHVTPGPEGPMPDMYLAGGRTFMTNTHGTVVTRNLTPDRETGLASRTDEDVKRVLRSGVYPDGRAISHTAMPWAQFSNWSDEDLHAVVVYLRHIKPVRHEIPPPAPGRAEDVVPGTIEVVYGQDAGKK